MSEPKTGSPKWKQTGNVPGPPRPGPIVKVKGPSLFVAAVEVGTEDIYPASSQHKIKKGDLQGWSKGNKPFNGPEWVLARKNNFAAVVIGDSEMVLNVTLGWPAASAIQGTLFVDAVLRTGTNTAIQGTWVSGDSASETFKAKKDQDVIEVEIDVETTFPQTVGGYVLELGFTAAPIGDPSAFTFTPTTVQIVVYTAMGAVFDADDDEDDIQYTGTRDPGSETGTQKRFDKLMSLFGTDMNHSTVGSNELEDLIWRMHTGINDVGSPPYFDAIHDEHLTVDGGATKRFDNAKHAVVGSDPLDVADQWLMWLPTPTPHWNTAACIGYVQLLKTMAASVGIFVHRAWVFPHTGDLPDGTKISITDRDIFCLGEEDTSKKQTASLKLPDGGRRTATLVLMEPNRRGENFEACLFTPSRHFLPGGYRTDTVEKGAAGFKKSKGFKTALDVLLWWCKTKRGSFQRFMCWADVDHLDADDKPTDFWDKDGKHYDKDHFEDIVRNHKEVPPPSKAKKP